jgi:peroxidase
LPALLGENYTKHNELEMLKEGFSNAYNETAEPTVSNSFATAILPFANSMLSDNIRFVHTSILTGNDIIIIIV